MATRARINRSSENSSEHTSPSGASADEAGYRRLVELSPMPIAVHIRGKLVFANQATAKLMAVKSPKDLIGDNIMEFVHPDLA